MEEKEQINALKAQAYDLLVSVEQHQKALNNVNQQIAELTQRLNAEVSKEKAEDLKPKETPKLEEQKDKKNRDKNNEKS